MVPLERVIFATSYIFSIQNSLRNALKVQNNDIYSRILKFIFFSSKARLLFLLFLNFESSLILGRKYIVNSFPFRINTFDFSNSSLQQQKSIFNSIIFTTQLPFSANSKIFLSFFLLKHMDKKISQSFNELFSHSPQFL